MNMDDDTQKEEIIIPSFGGVEDFLWVNLVVLSFWDSKTRSLVLRGLSLVASVPRGSILVDEGLDPCCFSPEFSTTLSRTRLENHQCKS